MRQRILLGATVDGEIAFGEVELTDKGLSVGFDTVKPFDTNDIDEDYTEDYLYDLDKETKYNLCCQYECSPQDLAYEFFIDHTVDEIVDCFLYPVDIEVNGTTYMFESVGCGQQELENSMEEYADKAVFKELINLWKQYHLRKLSSEVYKQVCERVGKLLAKAEKNIDEISWITDYIRRKEEEGQL